MDAAEVAEFVKRFIRRTVVTDAVLTDASASDLAGAPFLLLAEVGKGPIIANIKEEISGEDIGKQLAGFLTTGWTPIKMWKDLYKSDSGYDIIGVEYSVLFEKEQRRRICRIFRFYQKS